MSSEAIRAEIVALFSQHVSKPAYAEHDDDSLIDMIGTEITAEQYKAIRDWKKNPNPVSQFEELLTKLEESFKPEAKKSGTKNNPEISRRNQAITMLEETFKTKYGLEKITVGGRNALISLLTAKKYETFNAWAKEQVADMTLQLTGTDVRAGYINQIRDRISERLTPLLLKHNDKAVKTALATVTDKDKEIAARTAKAVEAKAAKKSS